MSVEKFQMLKNVLPTYNAKIQKLINLGTVYHNLHFSTKTIYPVLKSKGAGYIIPKNEKR